MDLKKLYRTNSTPEFSRRTGMNIHTARSWARRNGLKKDPIALSKIMQANADLRWVRRVPCALDADGLTHEISKRRNAEGLNARLGEMRMRCGEKFIPIEVIEKAFPACTKCKENNVRRN